MNQVKLQLKYIQDEITALLLAHSELEEDEVLRADMIQGETGAFEFLSEIVRKIGATKALRQGTTDWRGEIDERISRLERREHALRSLVFKIMQTADLKKAELPEATLSIRNGQQKVVIVNENEIPKEFLRVKTEPDKIRIRAAMLLGHEQVPGCALSNSEPTLAVIVK